MIKGARGGFKPRSIKTYNSEKIISQIVGISEGCDQNGERVSETDKICHICSMRLKNVLVRYEK